MIRALARGWSLLGRHKKTVCFFYLTNLLVASLLLLPFMRTFERSLGRGDYREGLLESLDYDWYELFQDRVQGFAATFSPSVTGWGPFFRNLETLLSGGWSGLPPEILGLGLIYLLANSYLTAAAVASAAIDPRGNSIREFFRVGGEYFGRFFRLSLLSVVVFALTYWVLLGPWQSWTQDMAQNAVVDRTAFLWRFSGLVSGGLLLAWLNLVFDYAKVITACSDRTSIILASISAGFFCLSRPASVGGLYLLLSLLGVLWIAVMTPLEGLIPQSTGAGILAAFLIQQLYLLGRLALRLYFYTSQMQLYLQKEALYRPED